MPAFIDLHSHWIPGVDDGARTLEEGRAILAALAEAGFVTVVATPHMRPALWDNRAAPLTAAYRAATAALADTPGLPALALSSEHYFDDVVFRRLLAGEGLPYPGGHAVLLEFYDQDFPPSLAQRFADLQRAGLLPVVAHPERYRPLWRDDAALERLVDAGAAALLDLGAVIGKYGREPERCARRLLERGLYHAACSDAHRASDVAEVRAGMRWVEAEYGPEELGFLLAEGPRAILDGRQP